MADGIERHLGKTGETIDSSSSPQQLGQPHRYTHAHPSDRIEPPAPTTLGTLTRPSVEPDDSWAQLRTQVLDDLTRAFARRDFDPQPRLSSDAMANVLQHSAGEPRTQASTVDALWIEASAIVKAACKDGIDLAPLHAALSHWPPAVRDSATIHMAARLLPELSADEFYRLCDCMLAVEQPQPDISLTQLASALDWRKDDENQDHLRLFLQETDSRGPTGQAVALIGLGTMIPLVAGEVVVERRYDFSDLLSSVEAQDPTHANAAREAIARLAGGLIEPQREAHPARRLELLREIADRLPPGPSFERDALFASLLRASDLAFKGRNHVVSQDLLLQLEHPHAQVTATQLFDALQDWSSPDEDESKITLLESYLDTWENQKHIERAVFCAARFIACVGRNAAEDAPARHEALENCRIEMLKEVVTTLQLVRPPFDEQLREHLRVHTINLFSSRRELAQAIIDDPQIVPTLDPEDAEASASEDAPLEPQEAQT